MSLEDDIRAAHARDVEKRNTTLQLQTRREELLSEVRDIEEKLNNRDHCLGYWQETEVDKVFRAFMSSLTCDEKIAT